MLRAARRSRSYANLQTMQRGGAEFLDEDGFMDEDEDDEDGGDGGGGGSDGAEDEADDVDAEQQEEDEDEDGEIEDVLDDRPMRVVDGLYISSYLAERNRDRLARCGITDVLQVAAGLCPSHVLPSFGGGGGGGRGSGGGGGSGCSKNGQSQQGQEDQQQQQQQRHKSRMKRRQEPLNYLVLQLLDAPHEEIVPAFPRAFAFIDAARGRGGACLVHCVAGVSRSAAVVLGWMMARGVAPSLDAALAHLRAVRPWVQPNPGFWAQLQVFERGGCEVAGWSDAWAAARRELSVAQGGLVADAAGEAGGGGEDRGAAGLLRAQQQQAEQQLWVRYSQPLDCSGSGGSGAVCGGGGGGRGGGL